MKPDVDPNLTGKKSDKYANAMTWDQLSMLMTYIWHKHRFPDIKYIRPHFDTRTGHFFGVKFDGGIKGEREFFIVNENRDKDLFAWICEWLKTTPEKVEEHYRTSVEKEIRAEGKVDDYVIEGADKAAFFKMRVDRKELKKVCQAIWKDPEKYACHGLADGWDDFLKYLWVIYPDGRERRLAEIATEDKDNA